MKTFLLHRNEDESGVSGLGLVAQGVVFNTGQVALSWLVDPHGLCIYQSVGDMMAVHAHGQKTVILWTY